MHRNPPTLVLPGGKKVERKENSSRKNANSVTDVRGKIKDHQIEV